MGVINCLLSAVKPSPCMLLRPLIVLSHPPLICVNPGFPSSTTNYYSTPELIVCRLGPCGPPFLLTRLLSKANSLRMTGDNRPGYCDTQKRLKSLPRQQGGLGTICKRPPVSYMKCNLTDSRFLVEYQNDLSKPGAQQTGKEKKFHQSPPGAKTSTSTGKYECGCRYTRQKKTCMTGRLGCLNKTSPRKAD